MISEPPGIVPTRAVALTDFLIGQQTMPVPVVVLDTTERPDVRDLLRMAALDLDPAVRWSSGQGASAHCYNNVDGPPSVRFVFIMRNPAPCEFSVELEIDPHRQYLELIASTGYLAVTHDLDSPSMAIEVPAHHVREALDSIPQ